MAKARMPRIAVRPRMGQPRRRSTAKDVGTDRGQFQIRIRSPGCARWCARRGSPKMCFPSSTKKVEPRFAICHASSPHSSPIWKPTLTKREASRRWRASSARCATIRRWPRSFRQSTRGAMPACIVGRNLAGIGSLAPARPIGELPAQSTRRRTWPGSSTFISTFRAAVLPGESRRPDEPPDRRAGRGHQPPQEILSIQRRPPAPPLKYARSFPATAISVPCAPRDLV